MRLLPVGRPSRRLVVGAAVLALSGVVGILGYFLLPIMRATDESRQRCERLHEAWDDEVDRYRSDLAAVSIVVLDVSCSEDGGVLNLTAHAERERIPFSIRDVAYSARDLDSRRLVCREIDDSGETLTVVPSADGALILVAFSSYVLPCPNPG